MVRVRVLIVVVVCLSGPFVPTAWAATIGDLVRAAEQADPAVSAIDPSAAAALTLALQTLRGAGVLDEDIASFVKRFNSPDVVSRAHRRQSRYTTDIKDAIDTIKAVANSILAPAGTLPPDLQKTVVELQREETAQALTWDIEILRRLERKYGPGSAKLNGLEVLANYGLQWSPWFGINTRDEPGPFEAVLAYVPSYFSRADEKMRLIGVAEIGLRQYIFRRGWGEGSGRLAFVRPAYTSYGVAWAGESDDPLTPPWRGSSRLGVFFGWGEIKAAYLFGDDQRFLVTQQIQLIPWVF
jgi:hypothetical protein